MRSRAGQVDTRVRFYRLNPSAPRTPRCWRLPGTIHIGRSPTEWQSVIDLVRLKSTSLAISVSSSVLPMLDAHLAAAPHSRYVGKEIVPLRRLDDLLESTVSGRKIFLKLDVQGFEGYVLAWGRAHPARSVSFAAGNVIASPVPGRNPHAGDVPVSAREAF